MSRVFTLFCHGTSSDRNNIGEIVREFANSVRNMGFTEYEDFLELDGPGSKGDKSHLMPGAYDPYSKDRGVKKPTKQEFKKEMKGLYGKEGKKYTGEEWKRSYANAVEKWQLTYSCPFCRHKNVIESKDSDSEPFVKEIVSGRKKVRCKCHRELVVPARSADDIEPVFFSRLQGLTWMRKDKRTAKKLAGLLTGAGWDDNVKHAVAAIAERMDDDALPDVVNMIGWSRGAVTCLRIANKLAELFPNIKVNIFAVDPVAGLDAGVKLTDTQKIGNNVKAYIATLALHDVRGGFRPQDLSRISIESGAGEIIFLPYPGQHNTQVKNTADIKGDVPKIVWHIAYKFLKANGTELGRNVISNLNAKSLCNYYARISVYEKKYERKLKDKIKDFDAFQGGLITRDVVKNLDAYVVRSDYFINEHHRECFKQAFPNSYKYLFTRRSGAFRKKRFTKKIAQTSSASAEDAVPMSESIGLLQELKSAHPILLKWLGIKKVSPKNVPLPGEFYSPDLGKPLGFSGKLHVDWI